jgi:hypothetical protein
MESTSNSPPPYEPEDIIELTNNFNSLQHFTEHQDDMLIYRSDYQIFDNNWRIWKHLERTKRQLQENILRTRLMVEQTEQQQRFLLTKANRYYHIIVTPEIRRRMNEPETVGHLLHPNTPTLRLRPLSPPPFISTEEITYQTASSSTSARQGSTTINRRRGSHTPPTMMPRNFISSTMRPEIPQLFRCRRCRSTRHQKRDCPKYKCLKCFKRKPGHYTHECPTYDDGNSRENPIDVEEYAQSISIDGDEYNYDYDPDGNLDGER